MSSPNKIKGSQWERDIVKALIEAGFIKVERMYGAGRQDDRGDIRGLRDWTIEAKNHAKIDLSQFLAELKVEMANAKTTYGAAVVKKRGKGVSESYVVLPFPVLIALLKETNA